MRTVELTVNLWEDDAVSGRRGFVQSLNHYCRAGRPLRKPSFAFKSKFNLSYKCECTLLRNGKSQSSSRVNDIPTHFIK